jgi:hypothetical protein
MFFKLQWRDTGIQSTQIRREEGASHSKGIIRKQKTTISTLVRLGLHILVQSSKESMALVDDRGHQTLPNKRPRSHSVMIPDEEEGELSLLRRAIELSSCVDSKDPSKRKYVFQNYWILNHTDRINQLLLQQWGLLFHGKHCISHARAMDIPMVGGGGTILFQIIVRGFRTPLPERLASDWRKLFRSTDTVF